MQPDSRTPTGLALDAKTMRRIRTGLIALGVVAVIVIAWLVVRTIHHDRVLGRWDELARLEHDYDISVQDDPLFEDPTGTYSERRDHYINALEAFLPRAEESDDALAPQVHYLIASLSTDQFYSARDPLQSDVREKAYAKAIQHWEILRDRYPDFQGNWMRFQPPGHTSIVRMVISTLEANHDWAKQNFAREVAPEQDVVVVLRTERGDMRLGLYSKEAPELAKRFLARVVNGEYDGTSFYAKEDTGSADEPVERTIRGLDARSRGLAPFDADAVRPLATDVPPEDPVIPAPSRFSVAAAKGVVAAWHDPHDLYDGAAAILLCVDRSPAVDSMFSPLGRLLDEPSRATASRIFEGKTWYDQTEPPKNLKEIGTFLRAPVVVVKALAYRDGKLILPEGTPSASRVPPEASEETLEGMKRDQYLKEPPAEPAPPKKSAPGDEGAGGEKGAGEGHEGSTPGPGKPSDQGPAPGGEKAPGASDAPPPPTDGEKGPEGDHGAGETPGDGN